MKLRTLFMVFIIFVVVMGACLILSAKWLCEGYQHQFYSGFLGSILATFFAAFLVWVAWEQLGNLGKTSSADFIHKLDNDFFTAKTRTLVSLIVCKALEFCPNDKGEPYFKVNLEELKKTKLPPKLQESLSKTAYYSALEVDDSLLGLFENVGMLERRRIVDFQMVYDVFAWYLKEAWNNDHIKEYIRYGRKEEQTAPVDTLTYYHFQRIAIKCLEYDDLHPGLCRWCWKIKRHFCDPKIERFPSIKTPSNPSKCSASSLTVKNSNKGQSVLVIVNIVLVIITAVIALANMRLAQYTADSNDRAARVFVAENRPLIDVTPIWIMQNPDGTHASTLFSISNFSGFTAYKVGIDLKYGENSWIEEWQKAEQDGKNKGNDSGVVKGKFYFSAPHHQLERLRPGETRDTDQTGKQILMSGSLNLEDVVARGKEGLTVAVRATWRNEKGHVFDGVHKYRLVGTTNSAKGRSFTFIPEGIVSQKDVVRN